MFLIRQPKATAMVALILSLLVSCADITGSTKLGSPAKSSTKALTAFSLSASNALLLNTSRKAADTVVTSGSGTIDEAAKTIAVSFPSGTLVTALTATFTTTGSSVLVGSTVQTSGTTVNNFTSPVVYRVTAEDGTTADYTVTVTVGTGIGTVPSSEKALTAFSLSAPASQFNVSTSARVALGATPAYGSGTINESAKTVSVSFPAGTAVTALVATFTTTGFSVKVGSTLQTSGTTANSFTAPVVYRVTAADGSTADYTVTVTVASAAVADTAPPALPNPSTLTNTATTTSVTLFWEAATDAAALSYQVRYRATPVMNAAVSPSRAVLAAVSGWTTAADWAAASSYPDTVSGTPTLVYTVTGLTLGQSYDFAVSVRDTSLNQSDYTVLTTSTVGDVVAPVVPATSPSLSTAGGVTTLVWNDASDEVTSVSNLRYFVLVSRSNISYGSDSAWTAASALVRDGSNRLTKTLVYNGVSLVSGNTYTVLVSVADDAGNTSSYQSLTYTKP